MKTLTVPYPQDFELAVSTTTEELEAQVRLMAALKMFELGKLSSWQSGRAGGHVARRVLRDVWPRTECQSSIMTRKICESELKGDLETPPQGTIMSVASNTGPLIALAKIDRLVVFK